MEVEIVDDLNIGEFDWKDLEDLEIFATGLGDIKTCKIGAHIIEMTSET